MTAYRNFIQDYPDRCLRLLGRFFENAQENDLEVTLLMNIASSGLIVPFARLSEEAHPSGDASQFTAAKRKMDELLDSPVGESPLFEKPDMRSWQIGEIRRLNGDPDSWDLDSLKPVTMKRTTRRIMTILRNALAHGNVFSRGHSHIEVLVFLSRKCHKKPDLGYEVIAVSPVDFKDFVISWLQMLAKLDIPGGTFAETDFFAERVA